MLLLEIKKMSISGQIVSDIVAQLYSENSIQTLLIFFGGSTPKKFRQFAPKCSFFVSRPLDIALSEYPYKSHNFRNLIFMTSSL